MAAALVERDTAVETIRFEPECDGASPSVIPSGGDRAILRATRYVIHQRTAVKDSVRRTDDVSALPITAGRGHFCPKGELTCAKTARCIDKPIPLSHSHSTSALQACKGPLKNPFDGSYILKLKLIFILVARRRCTLRRFLF